MKILHLITSLKIGGAESALVNFLHVAHNNPHEHIVAYFHPGPNLARIQALGIATHHITGIYFYGDPLGLWRLAQLIKHTKPNLIHSALWSANIIGRLMAKYFSLPIICDVHGNSFDEGKLRNWLDRITVAYATKIVAVSASTRDAYHANIIANGKNHHLAHNVITINNGIDCHALRARAQQHPLTRAEFGINEDDFVIGAIGRLEPIKSYDVLIRAFCKATNSGEGREGTARNTINKSLKLMIVGGGSQEQTLKNLCIELGIMDSVLFTGYRTDAVSFYPLFNCFALSSQSEGLSIALLEALCFGIPIITTNKTPNHDVIQHNVHGFIVPPNNTQALSTAIKMLFESKYLQESMHHACIRLIEHDFSLTKTIAAYHNVYTNACMKISQKN